MMLAAKLQEAAGNASLPVYIEDVFSTYLYTGTGSGTVTINNGIDVAGKGGLVWLKDRSAAWDSRLVDTARGNNQILESSTTAASTNYGPTVSLTSTGYTVSSGYLAGLNGGGNLMASWTFRKQPKFFDVVTYTGNGVNLRAIQHNLGSAPGCIIIKRTDTTGPWMVTTKKSVADAWGDWFVGRLNTTQGENDNSRLSGGYASWYGSYAPTATQFQVQSDGGIDNVNASGGTYVAYLFAHNAGGFGPTGTDNVISCGSFTTDGSGVATVNLGYEPQWVMEKSTNYADNWYIADNMRGMANPSPMELLSPNTSGAASSYTGGWYPTSTGFYINTGNPSSTYIYIAIRRGPMKTPTSGTSVFSPITTSSATGTVMTTNFPVDMQISGYRPGTDSSNWSINDRLRGVSTTSTDKQVAVITSSNAVETTGSNNQTQNWNNTGFTRPSWLGGVSSIYHNFRRAPGFFDEVCFYSPGSSAVNSQRHNLGVAPELIILKNRNDTYQWFVGANFTPSEHAFGYLNLTNSMSSGAYSTGGVFSAQPDATNFYYGNLGGFNYVAYLFASCPGVSKVGSYTGNGSTQTINCGFTGGARFVLIKRTDSAGSWFVWDTARGMVAGTDPRLALNSTAAESNADWVYTDASGFQIVTTDASVNASGGSYIYLAIA